MPDEDLHELHFVISRSWPPLFDAGQLSGLVRLAGAQARRLAGSQAWEYMMYVSVSGSQIATAFQHTTNTPPQLSQAESSANGPGLCDVRAFCRPLSLAGT